MAVETKGVTESLAAIDHLIAAIRHATPGAVDQVMDRFVNQIQVQLSFGQHAPGTQTGSVPPAPPWRITGHLRDTTGKTHARRIAADRWRGEAGPTAVYARIQELGGRTGRNHATRLPARPYARPAWKIVKPTAPRVFVRVWSDATRTALK